MLGHPVPKDYTRFAVALLSAILALLAAGFWRYRDRLKSARDSEQTEEKERSRELDAALQKIEDAVWLGALVSTRLPARHALPERIAPFIVTRSSSFGQSWSANRQVYERAYAVWRKAWMKTRPQDEELLERFRKVGLLLEEAVTLDPSPDGWTEEQAMLLFNGLTTTAIDDARARYWFLTGSFGSREPTEPTLPSLAELEDALVHARTEENARYELWRLLALRIDRFKGSWPGKHPQ